MARRGRTRPSPPRALCRLTARSDNRPFDKTTQAGFSPENDFIGILRPTGRVLATEVGIGWVVNAPLIDRTKLDVQTPRLPMSGKSIGHLRDELGLDPLLLGAVQDRNSSLVAASSLA